VPSWQASIRSDRILEPGKQNFGIAFTYFDALAGIFDSVTGRWEKASDHDENAQAIPVRSQLGIRPLGLLLFTDSCCLTFHSREQRHGKLLYAERAGVKRLPSNAQRA
jgi:hypothetical protein